MYKMQTKKAILLENVSAKVFQAIYLRQAKADEVKKVWIDPNFSPLITYLVSASKIVTTYIGGNSLAF